LNYIASTGMSRGQAVAARRIRLRHSGALSGFVAVRERHVPPLLSMGDVLIHF
jgi:hypothetical protein